MCVLQDARLFDGCQDMVRRRFAGRGGVVVARCLTSPDPCAGSGQLPRQYPRHVPVRTACSDDVRVVFDVLDVRVPRRQSTRLLGHNHGECDGAGHENHRGETSF